MVGTARAAPADHIARPAMPVSRKFDAGPASAIHAAREDAQCVLHTHSIDGVGVSAQAEGLLPLSQQSLFVLTSLGYHDYERKLDELFREED